MNKTIYGEMQGQWMYGSREAGLSGKWINEQPVYVHRDRSIQLAEPGSPAQQSLVTGELVKGFVLGVVANYIYDKVIK